MCKHSQICPSSTCTPPHMYLSAYTQTHTCTCTHTCTHTYTRTHTYVHTHIHTYTHTHTHIHTPTHSHTHTHTHLHTALISTQSYQSYAWRKRVEGKMMKVQPSRNRWNTSFFILWRRSQGFPVLMLMRVLSDPLVTTVGDKYYSNLWSQLNLPWLPMSLPKSVWTIVGIYTGAYVVDHAERPRGKL